MRFVTIFLRTQQYLHKGRGFEPRPLLGYLGRERASGATGYEGYANPVAGFVVLGAGRRWLLMKLAADTSMLVIGLSLVVGGLLSVARYGEFAQPYSAQNPQPADTATIYVGGSKGEAFWIEWGDFSGTLEGRKEGVVVGEEPVVYEIDLSQAPTDGSDTLEVRAGKSQREEGDLSLEVEVGDEQVGWDYTSEADPAISELYVSHTLGP